MSESQTIVWTPRVILSDTSSPDTQLHFAAMSGCVEQVRAALRAGAVLEAATESGLTALLAAALSNPSEDVSKYLASRGASHLVFNEDNETPLHGYAYWGWSKLIKKALDAGCPTTMVDYLGRSALSIAIDGRHVDVIELLIGRGADPCLELGDGVTAVNVATIDMLDVLLANGVDIDASSPHGLTALMAAARGGDVEKCRELIERGARIDLQDKDGQTPVAMAIEAGQPGTLALLLEAGADLSIAPNSGECAREMLMHETTQAGVRAVYHSWCARQAIRARIGIAEDGAKASREDMRTGGTTI